MTIDRNIVMLSTGELALEIKQDGVRTFLLRGVDPIIPQTKADIKHFTALVLGESQAYEDADFEPFKKGHT